ncbi:hypothetical protein [Winogradskyella sediminis]|uniref:AAA domain (Dynein-related subfamily) n=1 Tax=Winogradskyella sediminis TaxID=1382466 RepID=A0A1H1SN00_9FLAO|nr:hypothetical protein [Winogradskyella sediminis]SDS49233.1 hypothetical protein SAMN04489797_1717 [Winogradskyella sediminis]
MEEHLAHINDLKTIIGTRIITRSKTVVGYIRPEYSYISEFKVSKIENESLKWTFPDEGSVVVHNNFQTEIEEVFQEGELFKIEYEETKNYIPGSGFSKYQSLRGNASTIEKLPLIIEANIENIINDGIVYLPYQNHSYVFIKDEEEIFGPIAITEEVIDEELNDDSSNFKYNLQAITNTKEFDLDMDFEDVIHVFDIEDLREYIIDNDFFEDQQIIDFYITNIQALLKQIKPIRLILNESNDKIIKLINSQFPDDTIDSSLIKGEFSEVKKLRLKKFIEIQDKSKKWYEFIERNILPNYLKTEDGKEFVDEYFNSNKKEIIQTKIDEISREVEILTKVEEKKIKEKLLELENDKNNIINYNINAKKEKEILEEELEQLSDEVNSVKKKNIELKDIEEKIIIKKRELNIIDEISELDAKISEKESRESELDIILNNAQNKISNLEKQKMEIETSLAKISEDLIIKRIGEIQPYFELMNGSYNKYIDKEKVSIEFVVDAKDIKFNSLKVTPDTFNLLIEDLDNFLQSKGRTYKKEDVLNFVILYFQNFLIIFSGLPGIGKTSLTVLLSEFFTHKNCSLELAVSKGWNSRKVLFGYNNPINSSYQFDEFGFVKTMIGFNISNPDIPLNIILDEANLSPIEYYWSDFISLYDKNKNGEDRVLKLDLEGHERLRVPSQLKFMATINNDHTTERLSPRLIDRVPIISLEHEYLGFYDNQNEIDYSFNGYYSYSQLDSFCNPYDVSLLSKEEDIFKEVFNILKEEGGIIVSIRKMNAIKKYCTISRDLMSKYTSNQYAHIDYSIAQFALPQIQGQGTQFEIMIDKLLELFKSNQLSKSAKILKKIKDKGANFQVFSFFN